MFRVGVRVRPRTPPVSLSSRASKQTEQRNVFRQELNVILQVNMEQLEQRKTAVAVHQQTARALNR